MYEQRKVEPDSFRKREKEAFWTPGVSWEEKTDRLEGMGENDWYAVVNDIQEGTIVLQIASWPELDRRGRLRFAKIYEEDYPIEGLQQVVNSARTKAGQPGPDRPLRSGDAFWIHSANEPGPDLLTDTFDGKVVDITMAAREQAKIAMYAAVARKITPDEAESRLNVPPGPGRFKRAKADRGQHRPHIPGAVANPEV